MKRPTSSSNDVKACKTMKSTKSTGKVKKSMTKTMKTMKTMKVMKSRRAMKAMKVMKSMKVMKAMRVQPRPAQFRENGHMSSHSAKWLQSNIKEFTGVNVPTSQIEEEFQSWTDMVSWNKSFGYGPCGTLLEYTLEGLSTPMFDLKWLRPMLERRWRAQALC